MTATNDFAAPLRFASSGVPDIVRVARPIDTDRALHLVDRPVDPVPLPGFADTSIKPPSQPLPVARIEIQSAAAPVPGTVPATIDDPWKPLQHMPGFAPVALTPAPFALGIGLDPAYSAAQIAMVARSKARLDRAKAYAGRLASHLAEIRAKLTGAAERQVSAAIGTAEPDPADVGPLRGEAVEIDRQHRQALTIVADAQAEHDRHEADLAALFGSDGTARVKLAEAHEARALAQTVVNDAKAILDRARQHAHSVGAKLAIALMDEAHHDEAATARLHQALRDGGDVPAAAEPFTRTSPLLEDDLRTARATVEKLEVEYEARLSDLNAAALAVKGAVDGVLCAEAEAVAQELTAIDARALSLRVRLHTYTKRTAGDYQAPVSAPRQTLPNGMVMPGPGPAWHPPRPVLQTALIGRVIAAAPPPPHEGVFSQNWLAENEAWARYAAALAADPQAEPTFSETAAVPPAPPIPVRAS